MRLDRLIADGVAVIEIKSGYGLTIDDEIRMLRVARRLGELRPVKVLTTWLAAHALLALGRGRKAAGAASDEHCSKCEFGQAEPLSSPPPVKLIVGVGHWHLLVVTG